jgi:MoxR-like ATPase
VNAPLDPGAAYRRIADNVQRVIQGKPDVVRLAVVALFAEGHILLEDVPGLGKTSLAHSLARSIGGDWHRIQFTPDLLPGDITGSMVYVQDRGLEFRKGAVFTHIVLADEINRGTPKTQSALLEVMAERQVSVDLDTYSLPRPFLVVATQNPIELEGTYRLPEAQLDRFLMRLSVGYPDLDAEVRVIMNDSQGLRPDQLVPVIDLPTLNSVLEAVRTTTVQPQIAAYAAQLAAETRKHRSTRYGASPRGSIGLVRAARALAATESRRYVTPDDVKTVAQAVLAHRIVLTPDAELNRYTAAQLVREVLETVPAPGLGSGALPRVPAPRPGPVSGPHNGTPTRIPRP